MKLIDYPILADENIKTALFHTCEKKVLMSNLSVKKIYLPLQMLHYYV